MERIIFIGSHVDDVELACGGTINRLIAEGKDVYYLALSTCHEPVRLEQECRKSCEILGIKEGHLLISHFEVRKFPELRQVILQYLVDLQAKYKFDTVFTHSTRDWHQDHSVIGQESLRAFKDCSIFTYDFPWNTNDSKVNAFFHFNDVELTNKVNALFCYHSQSHREYMRESFIRAMGIFNGVKCGKQYAEAFESVRQVL